MKHWKKVLLALALCAALGLGIAIPASGASSGTVYLMAVNERVLDVTAENMPTVMGGVLYVPYTMLSIRDSGINLGVSALYSSTRRTVLVSNGQIGVIFNTQTNTAEDMQGNPVSARAMVRNTMVFLPIDYLCGYFDAINYTRVRTDYGILIRITNSAVVLRDPDFVDAAGSLLASSLRGYLASIETPAPTTAPTAPPVTPAPTAPPVSIPTAPPISVVPTTPPISVPTAPPISIPTAPPISVPTAPPISVPTVPPTAEPSKDPEPSESPGLQAEVLLALRWGEQGEEIAQLLEAQGERALFLFPCEELADREDAVRRLAAAGHTIGLILTGEDVESCAAQLVQGRRLLAEIARYHALIASAPALTAGGREALAREGCVLWRQELRGEDYRSGAALVEALSPQRANYVELDCGAEATAFLNGMLTAMEKESCHLRQVTAPLLS